MDKEKAKKAAEKFCKENNIDVEKLKGQWVQFFDDNIIFTISISNDKTGLVNDRGNECVPTLIIDPDYNVSIWPDGEKYLR